MGFGGSRHSTTDVQSNWPGYMQPDINSYLSNAMGLALPNGQIAPYDPALNQQVQGFNPTQEQAFGGVQGTVGNTQPLLAGQQGALQNMMGGPLAGASQYNLMNAMLGPLQGASQGGLYNQIAGPLAGASTGAMLGELGGPVTGLANQNAAATLSGQYMNPNSNPYLQGTYDQMAQNVTDQYKYATMPSMMAGAQSAGGTMGGTASTEQGALARYGLGQNLNNLANTVWGQNYQAERGRQQDTAQNQLQRQQQAAMGQQSNLMSAAQGQQQAGLNAAQGSQQGILGAAGQTPGAVSAAFSPWQQLLGIGGLQQQQGQTVLDTNWQNAMRQQQYPFTIMDWLGNALGTARGPAGQTQTSTPNRAGALK